MLGSLALTVGVLAGIASVVRDGVAAAQLRRASSGPSDPTQPDGLVIVRDGRATSRRQRLGLGRREAIWPALRLNTIGATATGMVCLTLLAFVAGPVLVVLITLGRLSVMVGWGRLALQESERFGTPRFRSRASTGIVRTAVFLCIADLLGVVVAWTVFYVVNR